MSPRPDATEFEATVEIAVNGGWTWSVHATNGAWPRWLSYDRAGLYTAGHTFTRWGARLEARRCLRKIKRFQNGAAPETLKIGKKQEVRVP